MVKGCVGAVIEVGIGSAVEGEKSNAYADGDVHDSILRDLAQSAYRVHRILHLLRLFADILNAMHARRIDHEFVTADSRYDIALAEGVLQDAAYALQEYVADRVAQRVIYALEIVDVDNEERPGNTAILKHTVYPVDGGTVLKPGQHVDSCHLPKHCLLRSVDPVYDEEHH